MRYLVLELHVQGMRACQGAVARPQPVQINRLLRLLNAATSSMVSAHHQHTRDAPRIVEITLLPSQEQEDGIGNWHQLRLHQMAERPRAQTRSIIEQGGGPVRGDSDESLRWWTGVHCLSLTAFLSRGSSANPR